MLLLLFFTAKGTLLDVIGDEVIKAILYLCNLVVISRVLRKL
jgi:hypothetical protein